MKDKSKSIWVGHSETGTPIFKYEPLDDRSPEPELEAEHLDQITEHVTTFAGPVDLVFHEKVSEVVHLDVLITAPSDARPFYTLVTSGMSDRPMTLPPVPGAEKIRYAELMLCLPPTWDLAMDALQDERNYWPIRLLKSLARFPHEYDTFLGKGHTVSNGDPAQPYSPETGLSSAFIATPALFDPRFHSLYASEGRRINFYAVIPIYKTPPENRVSL